MRCDFKTNIFERLFQCIDSYSFLTAMQYAYFIWFSERWTLWKMT